MNGAVKPIDGAKGGAADEQMFVFRELAKEDGTPGRTIAFTNTSVRPLGYCDLLDAKLHEKLTIPLEWHRSRVVETDIEGLDKSAAYNVKTKLESDFTSRAIGLVKGGWLPSAFAATHHRTTVLVDRNVVSQIIGRFDGGKRVGGEPDFLDLFADQPIRINPLLFVMEGNARAIPTAELVRDQLEEAVTKLRAALPSAELVVGPESINGALGLIEDSRPGFARKQHFLMRIAPNLAAPVSRRNVGPRWDEVIAAADECEVSRNSLVVLAALSSIVVPNGGSPAKKLLKFKESYAEPDAYNALADLRSLEVLMHIFALFPDQRTQLCTADKNLALFWTGIQASNIERSGDGITFDLSPVEQLLPGSTMDEWRSCIGDSGIDVGSGKPAKA